MRRAKLKESLENTTTDNVDKAEKTTKGPSFVVILVRIAATLVVMFVAIFFALPVVPEPSPRLTTLLGKFMYTLRWQVFSFFSLVIGINVVAFTRLFTPALNPLSPRGVPYVESYVRCLTNTLEQLVLSVPAQLILSGYLESENLKIIPILVGLFIIGRILFWIGYPLDRTYGFVLTFIPTILTLLADIYFFVTTGPTFGLD